MFFRLKQSPSGRVLQLLESYRNPQGQPRQRVVISLDDAGPGAGGLEVRGGDGRRRALRREATAGAGAFREWATVGRFDYAAGHAGGTLAALAAGAQ